MSYTDPVIARYIKLLQDNGCPVKKYYQGEPIKIPATDFPCITIARRITKAGPFNNADDEHEQTFRITVIADIRADLSTETNAGDISAGVATLYELIEARDENFVLKPNSVLGILRSHITLDAGKNLRTDLSSVTQVDYSQTLHNRSPEQWTIEGTVDFVSHFIQTR